MPLGVNMNIEQLNGIGPKNKSLLNKININTVEDLLTYYPYKYLYIKIKDINDVQDNESVYVKGTIVSMPKVYYIRRNFNYLSFIVDINNKMINVKIFNRAFMKNNLIVGKSIVLVGKYDKLKNYFMASDIRFNLEDNKIEAKYHLIKGLKENTLSKWINNALNSKYEVLDLVPEDINNQYGFINKMQALNYIHEPKNFDEIKKAKLKLIYEELLLIEW